MTEKAATVVPVPLVPGEAPPKLPWGWKRFKKHAIGIFVAPDGWYYNDEGAFSLILQQSSVSSLIITHVRQTCLWKVAQTSSAESLQGCGIPKWDGMGHFPRGTVGLDVRFFLSRTSAQYQCSLDT